MLATFSTTLRRALSIVLPLAVAACGGDDDASSTTTGGGSGGARTLETCETSIAADAPEPFASYFRCVTVTTTADAIVVSTRSLPPHPSYYYGEGDPNYADFDTTRGAEYHPNPNVLAERAVSFSIPREPTPKGIAVTADLVDGVVGTSADEYPMGPAGVALDSVPLFNPLAAPGDDIEQEKYTFDDYSAHPAPDGTYHYHTSSNGPLEVLAAIGSGGLELYGAMCDGTLVLGCSELDGSTPDPAGLDAQGGHVHDVADAGGVLAAARYHTHVCATGRRFTPEIQFYAGSCQ